MIRIAEYKEPPNFDASVRQPGQRFLGKKIPQHSKDWAGHEYWRRAIPLLRASYSSICSYTCHFIPSDTGSESIDHFVDKMSDPSKAYEWTNFRYACGRLNGRKGTRKVVDPFMIPEDGLFELHLPSMLMLVKDDIADAGLYRLADETIRILGLNDEETCVKARLCWLQQYVNSDMTICQLAVFAPFIAAELGRQGQAELIKERLRARPVVNVDE